MANRLARETSPYLRQHAENPVDWYPWSPEAFARARAERKPVLLSVGYAACHWCHVMERESFENPAIAELMNTLFVNIKVDREERPDVDAIYMSAVQALTGQGGWPMTVFLTPEGKPFYGGTYFPPRDRHGMPGFPRVLESVAEAYVGRPSDIEATAAHLIAQLTAFAAPRSEADALAEATLHGAEADLARRYDPEWGGFGGAPKFPPAMALEFLLRRFARTGEPETLAIVEHTLDRMARGGIYDHLGGGFHRYSVDAHWRVPHFEKMLYDNALLARIYTLAYQVTRNPLYRAVAEETLGYVQREMTSPAGGFYATQDADSEGEEGKFFVWTADEIAQLLGAQDAALFSAAFGISREGNFDGANVLHLPEDLTALAARLEVPREVLLEAIGRGRTTLFEARERRIKPARDEKIITAWNGMMMRAFALAGAVFGREDFVRTAEANARFIEGHLLRGGRLLRVTTAGQAKLDGYLEDYANVIDGYLETHAASLDPSWLERAIALTENMVAHFWDPATRAFFDTAHDHESLVLRPRDVFDNATPAGNSVAADVLLRLGRVTEREEWLAIAREALASAGEALKRYPSGMGRALGALDFALHPGRELVLVGPADAGAMRTLQAAAFAAYQPDLVLVASPEPRADVAILRDRPAREGQPTAYLCEGRVCQAPTTDPAALRQALGVPAGD